MTKKIYRSGSQKRRKKAIEAMLRQRGYSIGYMDHNMTLQACAGCSAVFPDKVHIGIKYMDENKSNWEVYCLPCTGVNA